jgi:hypothetical protein
MKLFFTFLLSLVCSIPIAAISADKTPITGNPAFDVLASWIGGEWRIDTRWDDGRPFRARGVWTWGPGKRFLTARTFALDDAGAETLLCENIFAVASDHVVNYAFGSDGSVSAAPMNVSDGVVDSIWKSEGSTLRQKMKIIGPDEIGWEFFIQESDGKRRHTIAGAWLRKR